MPRKPPKRPQQRAEHSVAEPQPKRSAAVPAAAATSEPGRDGFSVPWRCPVRTCAVPEGRRRRLAGGKSAAADAAPGNGHEWPAAPVGHRRNVPRCRTTSGVSICQGQLPAAERLEEGQPTAFLRCPARARPVQRDHRGPRPLALACPRLISCGVPPGRGARPRWQTTVPTPHQSREFHPCTAVPPGPPPIPPLPSHYLAPNSPAKLGRAQRLRFAPPARCWNFPAFPPRCTRSDRGPVALHFGCNSTALHPAHLRAPPAPARLNSPC